MSTPGTPGTPLSATPSTEPLTSGGTALRVLLVDDEELARLRLRGLLRDCSDPAAQVVGEAGQAPQALALLQSQPCDLVLLDIHMPGLDGTAARRRSSRSCPSRRRWCSSPPTPSMRCAPSSSTRWTTSPNPSSAIACRRRCSASRSAALRGPLAAGRHPTTRPRSSSATAAACVRVPVAEVLYLKAELKYVTLRTAEHTYVLDESLSDLETRLGERFLRVHRNALVARRAVRALERRVLIGEGDDEGGETWAVRLAPVDEWLAVSRRQVAAVREALLAAGL